MRMQHEYGAVWEDRVWVLPHVAVRTATSGDIQATFVVCGALALREPDGRRSQSTWCNAIWQRPHANDEPLARMTTHLGARGL